MSEIWTLKIRMDESWDFRQILESKNQKDQFVQNPDSYNISSVKILNAKISDFKILNIKILDCF